MKNLSPEIVAFGHLHLNRIFVQMTQGHITVISYKWSSTLVFLLLDLWHLRINKTARSTTPSVFVFRWPNIHKKMCHFMKIA